MKTINLNKILLLLLAMVALTACVQDDDFDTPDLTIVEPVIDGTIIEVQAVKALLEQQQASGETTFTFDETDNYLQGYVISSDEAGNFFEEIIIQNNFQDATAGLKILLDVNPLFGKYEVGRKIYVKLDGLSVGIDGGVTTVGILSGSDIEKISSAQETSFIMRSSEVQTIVPNVKTLAQISEDDVNTMIQLSSAQITESQLGLTYASEATDEFDGDRTIESCDADGGSILMQTSTFSDFKSLALPTGSGSITAILSKDFFGEQFTINVNSPEGITFTADRCEPSLLNPNISATTTFGAIVSTWQQQNDGEGGYVEFDADGTELILEGYVVSSDQSGNFFEELIIQNSIDGNDMEFLDDQGTPIPNPRLGFRVSLNTSDLYQNFPFGRKVYIKLNGLAVDVDNGVFNIGYPNVSQLEQIPDGLGDQFVIPGETLAQITPKVSSILALTESDENTWVQFSDAQINRNQLDLTYSAEPADDFDGMRTIESCEDAGVITLQTSTFADFKSLPVPQNRGAIQGVFSRDFGDDFNVLIVNSPADINFDNTDRCDPIEISCGLADNAGATNLFSDDFETQSPNSLVTGNGWTNFIQAGSEGWEAYTAGGANASQGVSARVGSFGSNDVSTVAWLITPQIDLDTNAGVTLQFESSNSFADGSTMEVLLSNDWDGTEAGIVNASWGIVADAYVVSDTDFFGDWLDSGIVDLSCESGQVYIAFKYTGSGVQEFDGTYELDFVSIDAQ